MCVPIKLCVNWYFFRKYFTWFKNTLLYLQHEINSNCFPAEPYSGICQSLTKNKMFNLATIFFFFFLKDFALYDQSRTKASIVEFTSNTSKLEFGENLILMLSLLLAVYCTCTGCVTLDKSFNLSKITPALLTWRLKWHYICENPPKTVKHYPRVIMTRSRWYLRPFGQKQHIFFPVLVREEWTLD